MYMIVEVSQYVAVASFSEAWIEIEEIGGLRKGRLSPPSRRRGLKSPWVQARPKGIRRLLLGGVD